MNIDDKESNDGTSNSGEDEEDFDAARAIATPNINA
jgi:hypothetical protein